MTCPTCDAVVWRRDTYRYTGRGKTGFMLHFNKVHCTRRAGADGLCWQHSKKAQSGLYVARHGTGRQPTEDKADE